jgi:hypothetical protein
LHEEPKEIAHLESPKDSVGFSLELEGQDLPVGIDHQVDEAVEVGILNKLPPLAFSDHIYFMNPALFFRFFPAA